MSSTLFKWCKDLDDVYSEKGKSYCVFHAPQGKKGISLEEFNGLIFNRINQSRIQNNECDLSGTIFEGDIDFTHYNKDRPLPAMNFWETHFNGEVLFMETHFSGDANFVQAVFNKDAKFPKAHFDGAAEFIFTRFNSSVDFWDAQFGGKADFRDAYFSKEANFSYAVFIGACLFTNAKFDDIADFSGATFKSGADFYGKTFHQGGALISLKISDKQILSFEEVDLRDVYFWDSDMRKMTFAGCDWRQKYGRKYLADELLLFGESEKDITSPIAGMLINIFRVLKKYLFEYAELKRRFDKVENLYRKLKQKYKDEHDEIEVSIWHYGEKEMFRKKLFYRRFCPSLSYLYWLSSGYGEKPVRAGVTLFALILGLASLFGLVISNSSLLENSPNPITLLLYTLQIATFQKETIFEIKEPSILWGYAKIVAQIAIPLQGALFALAVRNRFRR